MFKNILEYAGPYKKNLASAMVVLALSVLFGVLPFVFVYYLIVPLVTGASLEIGFGVAMVCGILACLVLQAILYSFGLSMSHKAAYGILMRLRVALQKKLEQLPLGTIQKKGVGTYKKLFVDDVDSLELLLAHSLPEGMANLIIPVVVYVGMFVVDWKLALMSLASIPLSLVAMMIMYSVGMSKMGLYYQAAQKMNDTIIEYVNGMEVIKVFNREAESYQRFRDDVIAYRDYTLGWYKTCWPWMALYNSLLPCTVILTLPFGSWFVLTGLSTLPNLILVLCLSLSIGIPLLKALGFLPTLPQLNYKIDALEQTLDEQPLKQSSKPFSGKGYDIEYSHVSFAYAEENVLENITLTAKHNTKTAFVGESGSGKSTLVKLLVHYYDVCDGAITIGGQDIRDMGLDALNDHIAYVSQDQYLFNTSLYENIRLGKPDASEAEVLEAARKAQCMDFIDQMPRGIYTSAGGAGTKLSGGQRQRISLARALLKDAPIIVLDEITSSVDAENEAKIESAVAELVQDKTLIMIAHKFAQVVDADTICMLEHGRLIDAGNHEELLTRCEPYQKLWQANTAGARWKLTLSKEAS